MKVAVVDGALLPGVLEQVGPDAVVVALQPTADGLEQLMREHPDPRVTWLIGDGRILPLPDGSVDDLLGDADDSERRRVLRA
jgi:hypothetical protein